MISRDASTRDDIVNAIVEPAGGDAAGGRARSGRAAGAHRRAAGRGRDGARRCAPPTSTSCSPRPAAFLVAIDGVTDPRNLGAIVRAAETAGATGLVMARHRTAGSPRGAKTAAGAIEYLPIALVGGIPAALERAERAGCWCIGLDGAATQPVRPRSRRPAARARARRRGPRPGAVDARRCDVLVLIPMRGNRVAQRRRGRGARAATRSRAVVLLTAPLTSNLSDEILERSYGPVIERVRSRETKRLRVAVVFDRQPFLRVLVHRSPTVHRRCVARPAPTRCGARRRRRDAACPAAGRRALPTEGSTNECRDSRSAVRGRKCVGNCGVQPAVELLVLLQRTTIAAPDNQLARREHRADHAGRVVLFFAWLRSRLDARIMTFSPLDDHRGLDRHRCGARDRVDRGGSYRGAVPDRRRAPPALGVGAGPSSFSVRSARRVGVGRLALLRPHHPLTDGAAPEGV